MTEPFVRGHRSRHAPRNAVLFVLVPAITSVAVTFGSGANPLEVVAGVAGWVSLALVIAMQWSALEQHPMLNPRVHRLRFLFALLLGCVAVVSRVAMAIVQLPYFRSSGTLDLVTWGMWRSALYVIAQFAYLALVLFTARFVLLGLRFTRNYGLSMASAPQLGGADGAPVAPSLRTAGGSEGLGGLGQSNPGIDIVVRSVIGRARASERRATNALRIIGLLVSLGAGVSVLLWATDTLTTTRLLERERRSILVLSDSLRAAIKAPGTTPARSEANTWADRVSDYVSVNYSDTKSYPRVMARLEAREENQGADIGLRTTVGVLTLLLIQVFFVIYRYHMHLYSMLADKAERLELLSGDHEAMRRLRETLSSVHEVERPPWGALPKSVVDALVDAAKAVARRPD